MSIKAEINDFFYDENRNILRHDSPIPEWITGDIPTNRPFVANPIPLNHDILVDCCKFTDNGNFKYQKGNISIELLLDGTWNCNGTIIAYLNDLQQVWRSVNSKELLIDLTNIQMYIY
ncbi:hypothetical protein ACIXUF_04280 [Bacteroides fragilis]